MAVLDRDVFARTEPEHGNAIHGLARFAPGEIAVVMAARVCLRLFAPTQPGYPFALEVEVEHVLDERGIPTGERAPVAGTAYDFATPPPIGSTPRSPTSPLASAMRA